MGCQSLDIIFIFKGSNGTQKQHPHPAHLKDGSLQWIKTFIGSQIQLIHAFTQQVKKKKSHSKRIT